MTVHEHHEEEVQTPSGAVAETTSASSVSFSPGQIIGGAVGIAACVFGVLAITRAGIDTTLNEPVVNAGGFMQSAALGIAEVVAGLLLLAGAANVRNRAIMAVTGGALFIAGILIAASSAQLLQDIGTEERSGWLLLFGGATAMGAATLPVLTRSARRVNRH